jgi:hypothetical protein
MRAKYPAHLILLDLATVQIISNCGFIFRYPMGTGDSFPGGKAAGA